MDPRINIITLGVKNIQKSRAFYEQGLGWKVSSISNEHFVAFHTQGIILCLFQDILLAEDAMTPLCTEKGFKGITLTHNVSSKEEVETTLKQAESAGAAIVKPPQDVFWGGYSGYFADPDGHLWEIAWNPHWMLDETGNLHLPD